MAVAALKENSSEFALQATSKVLLQAGTLIHQKLEQKAAITAGFCTLCQHFFEHFNKAKALFEHFSGICDRSWENVP